MNFYDGSGVTPFLPRHKIVKVLSRVNSLPSEWYYFHLNANLYTYFTNFDYYFCLMTVDITILCLSMLLVGQKRESRKTSISFCFLIATCFCLLRVFYSTANLYWDKNIFDNMWPVPKPYWYHGGLEASVHDLGNHKHIGRRLN